MPVAGHADWVAIAGASTWVASDDGDLYRFDQESGSLVGTLPLNDGICQAMGVGFGSVWVAKCDNATIVRVSDSAGTATASVPVPEGLADEASIAVTDTEVWALTKSGTITRISPSTNRQVAPVPAPTGASALRAGFGAVWVSNATDGSVTRLDPASGAPIATINVGVGARFMAVGHDSLWVMNNTPGTVSRIDPATNAVIATIVVSSTPIGGGDLAAGGGYVWARLSDSLVAKIDPTTNTVIARYGPASGSGSVGADDHAAWISVEQDRTVWRLPL
jgi:YVTN family beta-propeller protein